MTEPLTICRICESGTYDPVILVLESGELEIYCVRCHGKQINPQVVDN